MCCKLAKSIFRKPGTEIIPFRAFFVHEKLCFGKANGDLICTQLQVLTIFERKVTLYGNRKSVIGDGTYWEAHAAVRRSLHHLAVGGGAVTISLTRSSLLMPAISLLRQRRGALRGQQSCADGLRCHCQCFYNQAEIPANNISVEIADVYAHIFQIKETSSGQAKRHTPQHTDVLTHNIEILDL